METSYLYQSYKTNAYNKLPNKSHDLSISVPHFSYYVFFKGATKSYPKIIFVSTTKIGENTTNISNCHFSR